MATTSLMGRRRPPSRAECGHLVNPMIVTGQVHGGITQGIGRAMFKYAIYDDAGVMLTGSLLDYPRPTDLHRTVTPSPINLMVDALTPLGVKHIDMQVRPKRVWAAIQEARA